MGHRNYEYILFVFLKAMDFYRCQQKYRQHSQRDKRINMSEFSQCTFIKRSCLIIRQACTF